MGWFRDAWDRFLYGNVSAHWPDGFGARRRTLSREWYIDPIDALEWKITKLDVMPGDVVVVNFKDNLSEDSIAYIEQEFRRITEGYFPRVKFVILTGKVDLAVVRKADAGVNGIW